MTRRIVIKTGYRIDKTGKLVPCYKHLPVNVQMQRRSKRVRIAKPTART